MPRHQIPEELVTLVLAISEDKQLCERFLGLQQLPDVVREAHLLTIAAQMRSADEDASVVNAVYTLTKPRYYDAACITLRELLLSRQ